MNDRILHDLGLGRKLLLTTAAVLAIAMPLAVGLFTATPSRAQEQAASSSLSSPLFSTVSVKLSEPVPDEAQRMKSMLNLMDGSFVARGVTLKTLIQLAYHIQDSQIAEGPDGLNSLFKAKFDIDAKLDPSAVAAMHQQMAEHNSGDLKALLADKFKLAVHFENRTLPAYDLLVDENGVKMQPTGEGPRMMHFGRGELASSGAPLDLLTAQLSARLGRIVVDKTGLKDNYSFNLHWTPDPVEDERMKAAGGPVGAEPSADPNAPSLFTALQEQLGLKLKPHTEPVQILVVDHAELPSQE